VPSGTAKSLGTALLVQDNVLLLLCSAALLMTIALLLFEAGLLLFGTVLLGLGAVLLEFGVVAILFWFDTRSDSALQCFSMFGSQWYKTFFVRILRIFVIS